MAESRKYMDNSLRRTFLKNAAGVAAGITEMEKFLGSSKP